jgi:hypothetical protein
MIGRRARAACVLAAAGLIATLGAAPSAYAAPKRGGLEVLMPSLALYLPGQQGWSATTWYASTDAKVTGSGAGVKVAYPANTATYSSLFQSSSLIDEGVDFSALSVTDSVPVKLTSTAGTVDTTVT